MENKPRKGLNPLSCKVHDAVSSAVAYRESEAIIEHLGVEITLFSDGSKSIYLSDKPRVSLATIAEVLDAFKWSDIEKERAAYLHARDREILEEWE